METRLGWRWNEQPQAPEASRLERKNKNPTHLESSTRWRMLNEFCKACGKTEPIMGSWNKELRTLCFINSFGLHGELTRFVWVIPWTKQQKAIYFISLLHFIWVPGCVFRFQIFLSCSISKRASNLIQTEMFSWWLGYDFKHQYFDHENRHDTAAKQKWNYVISPHGNDLYTTKSNKISRKKTKL